MTRPIRTRQFLLKRCIHSLLFAALLAPAACGDEAPSEADEAVEATEHEEHEEEAVEDGGERVVELDPARAAATRLETATVTPRSFSPAIRTTGEVRLNDERTQHVVSRVSGWIERLDAYPQDRVGGGATLAVVYSPGYLAVQSELLQARTRLERAEASGDAEATRTARAILDAARTRLRVIGAGEAAIGAVLERAEPTPYLAIRSPFAGTVVESQAVAGSAVEPGDELFLISNLGTVWVMVDVYEDALRYVDVGDPVRIVVKAHPTEEFAGRITRVGDIVDPETRTVKARAEVANSLRRLKPGMFAEATIQTRGAPAAQGLAVPVAAVQRLDDEPVVFVVEGQGRYAARAVELGPEEAGWVRVDSGVESGERVVTDGSFLLKSELLKGTFEAGHGH